MNIDIQARDFPLTDSLRSHAKSRLRFALTSHVDQIQKITMRLSDINGPRGGADKRCLLTVTLAGLPDVTIENIEADLYVAIGRATDRARRTMMRRIERQKTLFKSRRRASLPTEVIEDLRGGAL